MKKIIICFLMVFVALSASASYFPTTTIASGSKIGITDGTGNLVGVGIDQQGEYRIRSDATVEDTYGHYNAIDFMHQMRVVMPHRLVGTGFMGTTIDPNFWTLTATGTAATGTQTDLDFNLTSGTASGSYAQLQSVRPGRFVFVNPMIFRTALKVTSVEVASNTRRWGVFSVASGTTTPDNGFYFALNASGVLSVNAVASQAVTSVVAGAFNGSVASITMDTNISDYEIHYFVMKTEFYRKNILLHTMTPTSSLMANSLSVPITIQTVNASGATVAGVIDCHAATIVKMGKDETQPTSKYFSATNSGTVVKYGAGIMHSLVFGGNSNGCTVTLYDNTASSGTVMYSTGNMSANTVPFSLDLHQVPFFTGLTILISGANCNVTIIYE